MQTLLIIVWITSAVFGLASWLLCSFLIAGTPRQPWFPVTFMGKYGCYRRVQKAVAEGGAKPRFFRLFEILFAASLASLAAALFLSVLTLLANH